ncbi:ATP-dependent DNA ligase [Paenarthrobacter ureafaciens]|uniref:ATP-dependent DNA ligase n=1 Tax=Paenarthrobacter ureafaciens TaxID=37931 RepID=UPI00140CAB2A|nr:ATP-dependent DNA ligase [Paenarthrobacter ureafaciens]MCX8454559.1 ATP-dependent DNA ligase [Paenarthrobacter ureafaciens]MCY0974308.1 ATP-dependent DNA ligase [Paenarthrobacter ureafaciens]
MDLPVMPPVSPMLAKSVPNIPEVGHYEPKWDGFRTIVFRDGDDVILGSRNEKPMTRYFPELVEALKENLPEKCVVDGEIILISGNRLDFEGLQQRIHPADSRVRMLAEKTPSSFVGFDLLALGDEDLTARPFSERRAALEKALADAEPPVYVTPAVNDLERAQEWFVQLEGAGLDGVLSKPLDGTYQPNKRVMFKTKHERTADCVVAGFRWHKTADVVGSMLLGLYDDSGKLHHVGVVAAFPMAKRKAMVAELEPYQVEIADHPWGEWATQETGAAVGSRMPGAQSRWSAGKDFSFVPLRPELVIEVAYDYMEGDRFRHTTQFRRWRPDRTPESCTYAQLEEPADYNLGEILKLQ